MPSATRSTGILAWRASNSGKSETWPDGWCVTTTNASPVSAGAASKNASRASRPPAEAPSPTVWNETGRNGAGSIVSEPFSRRALGEVPTAFRVRSAGRFRSIRTRRLTLGLPFLGATGALPHLGRFTVATCTPPQARRELLSADCIDVFVQSRWLDEYFRLAYGVQHGQHFEN